MTLARFVQLHYLTAFPGTLLNRDDAGLAKRLPFGGTSRIRISSQCLKRHWRIADGEHSLASLGIAPSVRSRATFDREIYRPLAGEGLDPIALRTVLAALQEEVLGLKEKESPTAGVDGDEEPSGRKRKKPATAKAAESGSEVSLDTPQVVVLGRPEIDYLKDVARAVVASLNGSSPAEPKKRATEAIRRYVKEHRPNLKGLAAGLDAALFGRMVTSDLLARPDAAIHVAHAFTVHAEEAETDYFSAVDDLLAAEQQLGSGHIGEVELTSGLFYGYVVVDVPLLVSNLEGCDPKAWTTADRSLAARVVHKLVHLVPTVSPGAKRGSTAPYAYATLVLGEAGTRQPRTLANAFLKAVEPGPSGDLRIAAVEALGRQLGAFDRMYGPGEERRVLGEVSVATIRAEEAASLDDLADWVARKVEGTA